MTVAGIIICHIDSCKSNINFQLQATSFVLLLVIAVCKFIFFHEHDIYIHNRLINNKKKSIENLL